MKEDLNKNAKENKIVNEKPYINNSNDNNNNNNNNDKTNKIKEKDKDKNSKVKTLSKVILILFIIFLVLFIIGVILGGIYLENQKKIVISQNASAIKQETLTLEYGDSLTYEDIVEKLINTEDLKEKTIIKISVNDKNINPNETVKLDNVGDLKIDISALNNIYFLNADISKEVVCKVEDSKKPKITGIKDLEVTQGDKIDLKKNITASDPVDGKLEVEIEGKYDLNKPGEYTLTAKVTDKNNNITKKNFKVVVKEKEEEKEEKITIDDKVTTSNKNNGKNNSKSNSNSSKNVNSASKNNLNTTTNKAQTNSSSTKEGRLALAKKEAKKVVANIIKPGMTKKEKAEAICMYITNTVTAQNNQSTEAYKTNYGNEAYAALILKKAACSGRCKAVTLLCDAAGLESKHINQNQWTHQWNKVKIDDGSWIVIDSQIGYIGEKHPLEFGM